MWVFHPIVGFILFRAKIDLLSHMLFILKLQSWKEYFFIFMSYRIPWLFCHPKMKPQKVWNNFLRIFGISRLHCYLFCEALKTESMFSLVTYPSGSSDLNVILVSFHKSFNMALKVIVLSFSLNSGIESIVRVEAIYRGFPERNKSGHNSMTVFPIVLFTLHICRPITGWSQLMISLLTAAIAWNANINHKNAMFLLILNVVVNTITKITYYKVQTGVRNGLSLAQIREQMCLDTHF